MEYSFKSSALDKLSPLKFKINYWLLRKLGLVGYGVIAFLWGSIITIIIYEVFLN